MPRTSRFSSIDFEQMKVLYASGLSTKQIAAQFDKDGGTIYHHLERREIEFRTPSESKRQYTVWEEAFERIDTEEKAYWLGFLYADGCVLQQRGRGRAFLILQSQDYSHIEKFRRFLKSDYPIHSYPKSGSVGIRIASEKMFHDLVLLGCIPRKSLYLQWPKSLPFHLSRHFIRGYFDGDGSAFVSGKYKTPTMSFMTDISFVQPLTDAIYFGTNATGQVYKHQVTERGRILVYRGEYKVQALGSWLYKDASISLERKHGVFLGFQKPGKRNYPCVDFYGYGSDGWDYRTQDSTRQQEM
jgi:hypothetical protein